MNKELFRNMLADDFSHVAGATRKMETTVIGALRRASARVMRESSLTGETRQEVSRRIYNELGKEFAFTDAGGKVWNSGAYFKMLGRTMLHNNARECYLAECAAQGSDIVTISISGNPCPHCAEYEDRLFSISGKSKKYPSLQSAMDGGLFHPNCTHRIVAVPEEIAEEWEQPNHDPGKDKMFLSKWFGGKESGQTPKPSFEIKEMRGIGEQTRQITGLKGDAVNLEGLTDVNIGNQMNAALHRMVEKYHVNLTGIKTVKDLDFREPAAISRYNTLELNAEYLNNLLKTYGKFPVKNGKYVGVEGGAMYQGREMETIVCHETAHALLNGMGKEKREKAMELIQGIYRKAVQNGDTLKISKYAEDSPKEFFSEIFTARELAKEKLPGYIENAIEEVLK